MKKFIEKNRIALIGGLIGIMICLLLFVFYMFVYFPYLQKDSDQSLLSYQFSLPAITGHLYPMMSHFLVEGANFTSDICPNVDTVCNIWTLESGCIESTPVPDANCIDKLDQVISLILTGILIACYFVVGFALGKAWQIKCFK